MKRLLVILSFGLLANAYGQKYPALKKVLNRELSEKSTDNERWVFYSDNGDIEKMDKPFVKAVIPNYDFYKVTLINHFGSHINQGTCIVLFDSAKSKIILVEPLWYGGVSVGLIKLIIGKKITNKDSLLNFLTQLNELLQVGSQYKYRQTSYTDSLVTFDLCYFKGDSYTTGGAGTSSTVRYNEERVWRTIMIELKDFAIIRYTEIMPGSKEREVIE